MTTGCNREAEQCEGGGIPDGEETVLEGVGIDRLTSTEAEENGWRSARRNR
jgi:hypothetical protein